MKAVILFILLFLTALPVSAQKDELRLLQTNIDSVSYVKPVNVSIFRLCSGCRWQQGNWLWHCQGSGKKKI